MQPTTPMDEYGRLGQTYERQLAEREDELFESEPEYPVDFLEAYDGEPFEPWKTSSTSDLERRLWVDRKDPVCRHVFIQAGNSISPLDCSKEAFQLLLSFHHVMPRFLDLVFGFGQRSYQSQDFHYAAFHHEDFLSESSAKECAIERLGRSGRLLRHCYNLWSVEKSDADGSWSFRQTAAYHSFDVDKGRAFWINIKANSLMLKRISEIEQASEVQQRNGPQGASVAFSASLITHLVIFEWCCENWNQFLGDYEREISQLLTPARNAPLAKVEQKLAVDFDALLAPVQEAPMTPPSRAGTMQSYRSPVSRRSTMVSRNPPASPRRLLTGLTSVMSAESAPPVLNSSSPIVPAGQPPALAPTNPQRPQDQYRVFKEFSIQSLQRLGSISSILQEAALVMKIDADVLTEVTNYYARLADSPDLPADIKARCAPDLSAFHDQTASHIRTLTLEQTRIATLLTKLEDGKRLFDTVLQFRNVEVNKAFAVTAHESARRMEGMTAEMHASALAMEELTGHMSTIAERTERETASMHIITLVTLVFLPGTFVAVSLLYLALLRHRPHMALTGGARQTLFGSGLYQWDQNDPEMLFPRWKQEYFYLFAKICFPITFGVMLVWGLLFLWFKRRDWFPRRESMDEEAQVDGVSDEKGINGAAGSG